MKLYDRETSYYTIITIPKCLVSKYGKKQIWRSLNTKDYKLAKLRAELETMSTSLNKIFFANFSYNLLFEKRYYTINSEKLMAGISLINHDFLKER